MKDLNKKSLAIIASMMFVFALSVTLIPSGSGVGFVGSVSASNLGDNITTTLEEWLPLVIMISFVVIILAALGIKRLGGR